jgi:hypothetical protein
MQDQLTPEDLARIAAIRQRLNKLLGTGEAGAEPAS